MFDYFKILSLSFQSDSLQFFSLFFYPVLFFSLSIICFFVFLFFIISDKFYYHGLIHLSINFILSLIFSILGFFSIPSFDKFYYLQSYSQKIFNLLYHNTLYKIKNDNSFLIDYIYKINSSFQLNKSPVYKIKNLISQNYQKNNKELFSPIIINDIMKKSTLSCFQSISDYHTSSSYFYDINNYINSHLNNCIYQSIDSINKQSISSSLEKFKYIDVD